MPIIIERETKRDRMIAVDSLPGAAFTQENGAHQFIITCTRNGEKETLAGTVTGRFIRANGTSILLSNGSISNGSAVLTLEQDCYNVPGRFKLVIFCTNNGVQSVIYAAVGEVQRSKEGTLIDSGEAVPSIDDLLDKIDDCETATAAATAAAAFVPNMIAVDYANLTFPVAAGTPCTKGGYYYIAKTDIATSETWTAAHWTAVKAGDQISDLKNVTNNIEAATLSEAIYATERYNSSDKGRWKIGENNVVEYASDGGSGYSYALKPIVVEPGDVVHITMGSTSSGDGIIFASYENDVYTAVDNDPTPQRIQNFDKYYTVPAGANRIMLTKYGANPAYCNKIVQKTDKTLTEENVAADAQSVGNGLEFFSVTTGIVAIPFTSGYYIRDNYDAGTEISLTPISSESDRNYAVIPAAYGDKFTINATGGSYGRLWCFINADNEIISVASSNAVGSDLIISAPVGTAKLIINAIGEYGLCYKGVSVPSIEKRVSSLENTETIKSYYISEAEDTIQKVRNEITSPALVFAWNTDNHRYSANADGVQNFADMIENTKYLARYIPLDFVLCTGDLTDGNQAQDTTLSRAYGCMAEFMSIGVPYVWAQGNHDTNYYGNVSRTFTLDQCYKAYFTATKRTSYNASELGTDYYIDFDALNTRLVVLNANNVSVDNPDYPDESDNPKKVEYALGASTAQWLTSTAFDTDKNVILALHQSPIKAQLHKRTPAPTNWSGTVDAINAFITGGGNLIMISGHSHVDVAFPFPWLSIMQDCQRFVNTNGESLAPEDADATTGFTGGFIDYKIRNARTSGTYTEDLWSVCVYKPDVNDLSLIRFGAGADRHFHVTPIAPGTVATKLEGTITWSTSDSSVATVSSGVITGVATGNCAILAKDENGNYECWIVNVT